jgi:hypothetical protein
MRKYLLILFAISLIGVSCEKENSTLISLEEEPALAENETTDQDKQVTLRGNQPRPFKGTIEYETVADNGLACNCPSGDKIQIEGSGNVTHLGRVSSATTYCLIIGAAQGCPGPGGLVTNACLSIEAANGDEVFLDVQTPYETCITNCCFEASIQGTFNGGTGRFSNASGDWTAEIVQELGSSISEVTVDGQIVY